MRLSRQKQYDIAEKIKEEMYDKAFKAIDVAQADLVYKNYLLWVAPYKAITDQLPEEMVSRDIQVTMTVDEHVKWAYYHTSELVTTVRGTGWNASAMPIPVDDSIKAEVEVLLAKEKELHTERNELMDYVNDSLEKLGTTVRLRKAWPQALQKYIPAEPPRATRKAKQEVQVDLFHAPTDAIKQRMTQNLLED